MDEAGNRSGDEGCKVECFLEVESAGGLGIRVSRGAAGDE